MKYTKTLVPAIINAVENSCVGCWWGVATVERHDDIGYAVIRFEDMDGTENRLCIAGDVVSIVYGINRYKGGKWLSSFHLPAGTRDQFMIWLGKSLFRIESKIDLG